ncbi:8227_t:CDS:2, partial [Cetraspora pellucida]
WFDEEPTCILREFNDFSLGSYPFNDKTYNQFGDIWKYWSYAKDSTKELGLVACWLYGVCVNAAAVERLWSCMSFLQTDRRNRLIVISIFNFYHHIISKQCPGSSKALDMCKLRAAILWEHAKKSDPVELLPPTLLDDNDNQMDINPEEHEKFDSGESDKSGEIEPSSEEYENLIMNKDFDDESPDSDSLQE